MAQHSDDTPQAVPQAAHAQIASNPSATHLSPILTRSPSVVVSPPLSPRLAGHPHHSRSPSFSSSLNMVDLLTSMNGEKPAARDWAKISLSELVQGQKLTFVDGDTPVEEACQVRTCDKSLTVDAR
jgi:hypothetical protein